MTAANAREFLEFTRQINFALEMTRDTLKDIEEGINFICALDKKYKDSPEVKALQRLHRAAMEKQREERRAQQIVKDYINSLKDNRKKEYLIYYVAEYVTDKKIQDKFFYADLNAVYKLKGKAAEILAEMPAEEKKKIKTIIKDSEKKFLFFLKRSC